MLNILNLWLIFIWVKQINILRKRPINAKLDLSTKFLFKNVKNLLKNFMKNNKIFKKYHIMENFINFTKKYQEFL